MKPKKVPMRMCVGCREMKPKRELVRVVRMPDGVVKLDKTSKAPGRGAYVCPDLTCLSKAVKTRALDRALEQKLDSEILDALKGELESQNE